jgi:hypothetical protein
MSDLLLLTACVPNAVARLNFIQNSSDAWDGVGNSGELSGKAHWAVAPDQHGKPIMIDAFAKVGDEFWLNECSSPAYRSSSSASAAFFPPWFTRCRLPDRSQVLLRTQRTLDLCRAVQRNLS